MDDAFCHFAVLLQQTTLSPDCHLCQLSNEFLLQFSDIVDIYMVFRDLVMFLQNQPIHILIKGNCDSILF